ncbi:MAG: MFS transporter [Devosia sp.]
MAELLAEGHRAGVASKPRFEGTLRTDMATDRPLWQNRDYVLLWTGQAISIVGSNASLIAFPLLVLGLTDSPLATALVAAARSVPYLLFTLPAGALVDRWNLKATMVVCSVISALAMASVLLPIPAGALTVWHLATVSFLEGSCGVFFRLAETSALTRIVPNRHFPRAIAQQQLQYSLGAILGPPLGAIFFSTARLLPFIVDAGSYAISCLTTGAIRANLAANRNANRRSLGNEIKEGLLWLWHHRLIRFMAGLSAGQNSLKASTVLLIVLLAARHESSPALAGIALAACGVGGVVGALVAPWIQRRFSFGQAIVAICWAHCLIWMLFPIAVTPLHLIAIAAVSSFVGPAYDTVQMSYRLALIPRALQGRVNSAYRLAADGSKAIGAALTGFSLEWIGLDRTLWLTAGLFVLLAIATTSNRAVREAPRLDELQ